MPKSFHSQKQIMVDAREFDSPRMTGIGRFLSGLLQACLDCQEHWRLLLGVTTDRFIPQTILEHSRVSLCRLPSSFLRAEKHLSHLSRQCDLYLSPYPKLPMFGAYCPSINVVHDVHDLTHEKYRQRFRTIFDRLRLRHALRRAELTWFVSAASKDAAIALSRSGARNPVVRHNALPSRFQAGSDPADQTVVGTT